MGGGSQPHEAAPLGQACLAARSIWDLRLESVFETLKRVFEPDTESYDLRHQGKARPRSPPHRVGHLGGEPGLPERDGSAASASRWLTWPGNVSCCSGWSCRGTRQLGSGGATDRECRSRHEG
jgi:hypothetical protein